MLKKPEANSPRLAARAEPGSGPDAPDPHVQPKPVAGSSLTVGATLIVEGNISGTGGVSVRGTIDGNIDVAENEVSVEGTGLVKGNIVGNCVTVEGRVAGDIEALEKITIQSSGIVKGTIVAPRIEIADGARFKGRINMDIEEGGDGPPRQG